MTCKRSHLTVISETNSSQSVKVRLHWTRSEGWRPSRVVDYVTREGCQPSRVVANLRDWSLHRLILTTYF